MRCLAFATLTDAMIGKNVVTYADSAASRHFFTNCMDFVSYNPPSPADAAGVTAKGQKFQILGSEQVRKWTMCDGELSEMTFENALHASNLAHNLISLGSLVKKGVKVGLENGGAVLMAPDGRIFMRCQMEGTMFVVTFTQPPSALSAHLLTHPTDYETWHQRLAHVGESTLHEMICKNVVTGLTVTKLSVNGRCEDCIMGKHAH